MLSYEDWRRSCLPPPLWIPAFAGITMALRRPHKRMKMGRRVSFFHRLVALPLPAPLDSGLRRKFAEVFECDWRLPCLPWIPALTLTPALSQMEREKAVYASPGFRPRIRVRGRPTIGRNTYGLAQAT